MHVLDTGAYSTMRVLSSLYTHAHDRLIPQHRQPLPELTPEQVRVLDLNDGDDPNLKRLKERPSHCERVRACVCMCGCVGGCD